MCSRFISSVLIGRWYDVLIAYASSVRVWASACLLRDRNVNNPDRVLEYETIDRREHTCHSLFQHVKYTLCLLTYIFLPILIDVNLVVIVDASLFHFHILLIVTSIIPRSQRSTSLRSTSLICMHFLSNDDHITFELKNVMWRLSRTFIILCWRNIVRPSQEYSRVQAPPGMNEMWLNHAE